MMRAQGADRVTVAYIGFLSSVRVGGVVGAAFSLLPSLLFAFGGTWGVHWTRTLLDGWSYQAIRLPLVGNVAQLNVVQLLHLEGPYSVVAYWDDRLPLTFALLWLVPWSMAVLGGAVFAATLTLVYNSFGMLGGGVEVDLAPSGPRGELAASGRAQYLGGAGRSAPRAIGVAGLARTEREVSGRGQDSWDSCGTSRSLPTSLAGSGSSSAV